MRIAAALVLTLFLARSANADPFVYDLVTDKPGVILGSTLTGTITFPDTLLGASVVLASELLAFDIQVVGYAPAGLGWVSTNPSIFVQGHVVFGVGVVGDAILRPLFSGSGGGWNFNIDPNGNAPRSLNLNSVGSSQIGWQWEGGQFGDFALDESQTAMAWHLVLRQTSLTAPVPEPTSLVLVLIIGGVAAAARQWRARRAGLRRCG